VPGSGVDVFVEPAPGTLGRLATGASGVLKLNTNASPTAVEKMAARARFGTIGVAGCPVT
jgi:hypothetical protein